MRRVRYAYHAVEGRQTPTGGWYLRLGRPLVAPHGGWHNPHWGVTARERREWTAAVRAAVLHALGRVSWGNAELDLHETRRMTLRVIREVPTRRHFIRDRDNLLWSTKRLRDALRGVGLIRDDSMKWLVMADPEQRVSADGQFWTVVALEPAEAVSHGTSEEAERPDRHRPRAHRVGGGKDKASDFIALELKGRTQADVSQ